MELVEGQSLSDRITRGPLPVSTVLDIAGPVADALDKAHVLGLVHRDIKSANLMLNERGRVKVLDFGLAKVIGLDEAAAADQPTMAETRLGTVVGTVKIDGAISDIFGLQDKIVYELSPGMNLTLNESEVAAIEQKKTESVEAYEDRSRAMINLMEGSPQSLDRAIHMLERATERDPKYAAAWAALGAAYDLKGSFLSLPDLSHRAIDMERRAIALNPKLADAHRWLGLSLMSVARYDDAIAAIREAARLEPDDAAVYSSLGRAYWVGKGQLDEGIAPT